MDQSASLKTWVSIAYYTTKTGMYLTTQDSPDVAGCVPKTNNSKVKIFKTTGLG